MKNCKKLTVVDDCKENNRRERAQANNEQSSRTKHQETATKE